MNINWHDLNTILSVASEERVAQLLEDEVTKHKRSSFIVRLHQRYTTLRAQRERKQLLDRATS